MKKIFLLMPGFIFYLAVSGRDSFTPKPNELSFFTNNETDDFVVNEMPGAYVAVETDIREPSEIYKGNDVITATFQQAVSLKDDGTLSRLGVAADGITRLVVILQSDKALTISLPLSKDGSLSTLDNQGARSNSDLTISPTLNSDNKKYIVFVYYAPDSYGPGPLTINGRDIKITTVPIDNPSAKYDIVLKVNTPPVVLMHGMWSNSQVWVTGQLRQYLISIKHFPYVVTPNYNNIETFIYSNNPSQLSDGVKSLYNFVPGAIKAYNKNLIAATQVDVVGHSLGGLITRSFIQSPSYKAQKNYLKGYVHKLITLGTPHLGSPVAKFLWDHKDTNIWAAEVLGEIVLKVPALITVREALALAGKPLGSCHEAFVPGSDALRALTNTPVKCFAITGDYAPDDNSGYYELNTLIHLIDPVTPSLDNLFNDRHDLIVAETSQKGGLSSGFTATYPTTVHSAILKTTVNTETNSLNIRTRVSSLLLENNPNLFAPSFPAPVFRLTGRSMNESTVLHKNTVSSFGANDYIKITSPANGSVFLSNNPDSITLEFAASGAVLPTSGVFMIPDIGVFAVPGTPPYRVKFKLPLNTPLNKLAITAFAGDISGGILFSKSTIYIKPVGFITNLSVNPSSLSFDSLYNQQQLSVTANLINGADTALVDLTHAQSGTVYKTKKGAAIIQVDSKGVVTALKAGTDTLEVRNGNNIDTILVVVTSACSLSKPTISISRDTLISSSVTGNHWYSNGLSIEGATSNKFIVTTPGAYSVQVIKSCTSPMSDVIQIRTGLLVSAKVFLQGSYNNSSLMTDTLRSQGLLPTVEPYQPLGFVVANTNPTSETLPIGLFDSTGNKAITDWVWMELRYKNDSTKVVSSRSALLRRDGNVVDMDGVSPVRFYDMPDGNYFLALRHRNHLGVMTATSISLNNTTAASINFTLPATATYTNTSLANAARKNINGIMVLWAGDVNGDGIVRYTGNANDKDALLAFLGLGNTGKVLSTYSRTDVNLNGQIRYIGSFNDKDVILGVVGLATQTNAIYEHLPK